MARKLVLTPSAEAVARCIHARQGVTFQARGPRRLRTDLIVTFILAPISGLEHVGSDSSRGEWLVWQDHTSFGTVGRLPADGSEMADALSDPSEAGEVVRDAMRRVMDAVWRLVAD